MGLFELMPASPLIAFKSVEAFKQTFSGLYTFAELVPPNDRKLQGVRVKLLKEQHHYNIMIFLGLVLGHVIQTSGKTDSMDQRVC